MIPGELLNTIESGPFQFQTGVVSSQRDFERAVRNHPAIAEVFPYLREEANREHLAARVQDLAHRETDVRFKHPLDTAIAAYLLLLDVMAPELAEAAASHVARVPNLGWARPIAQRLLSPRVGSTDADAGDREEYSAYPVSYAMTVNTAGSVTSDVHPPIAAPLKSIRTTMDHSDVGADDPFEVEDESRVSMNNPRAA